MFNNNTVAFYAILRLKLKVKFNSDLFGYGKFTRPKLTDIINNEDWYGKWQSTNIINFNNKVVLSTNNEIKTENTEDTQILEIRNFNDRSFSYPITQLISSKKSLIIKRKIVGSNRDEDLPFMEHYAAEPIASSSLLAILLKMSCMFIKLYRFNAERDIKFRFQEIKSRYQYIDNSEDPQFHNGFDFNPRRSFDVFKIRVVHPILNANVDKTIFNMLSKAVYRNSNNIDTWKSVIGDLYGKDVQMLWLSTNIIVIIIRAKTVKDAIETFAFKILVAEIGETYKISVADSELYTDSEAELSDFNKFIDKLIQLAIKRAISLISILRMNAFISEIDDIINCL